MTSAYFRVLRISPSPRTSNDKLRELQRICGGQVEVGTNLSASPEAVLAEARRRGAHVIAVDVLRDHTQQIAALAARYDIAVVVAPLEMETADRAGRGVVFKFKEYERVDEHGERFHVKDEELGPEIERRNQLGR